VTCGSPDPVVPEDRDREGVTTELAGTSVRVVARQHQRPARAVSSTAARRDTDMKFTGLILMMIGILDLVIGGINYSRQRTVLEVESFRATANEHRQIPSSAIVGGVVLLGGTLLLAYPRRRFA
jgi:hypothetical protein